MIWFCSKKKNNKNLKAGIINCFESFYLSSTNVSSEVDAWLHRVYYISTSTDSCALLHPNENNLEYKREVHGQSKPAFVMVC